MLRALGRLDIEDAVWADDYDDYRQANQQQWEDAAGDIAPNDVPTDEEDRDGDEDDDDPAEGGAGGARRGGSHDGAEADEQEEEEEGVEGSLSASSDDPPTRRRRRRRQPTTSSSEAEISTLISELDDTVRATPRSPRGRYAGGRVTARA